MSPHCKMKSCTLVLISSNCFQLLMSFDHCSNLALMCWTEELWCDIVLPVYEPPTLRRCWYEVLIIIYKLAPFRKFRLDRAGKYNLIDYCIPWKLSIGIAAVRVGSWSSMSNVPVKTSWFGAWAARYCDVCPWIWNLGAQHSSLRKECKRVSRDVISAQD